VPVSQGRCALTARGRAPSPYQPNGWANRPPPPGLRLDAKIARRSSPGAPGLPVGPATRPAAAPRGA